MWATYALGWQDLSQGINKSQIWNPKSPNQEKIKRIATFKHSENETSDSTAVYVLHPFSGTRKTNIEAILRFGNICHMHTCDPPYASENSSTGGTLWPPPIALLCRPIHPWKPSTPHCKHFHNNTVQLTSTVDSAPRLGIKSALQNDPFKRHFSCPQWGKG